MEEDQEQGNHRQHRPDLSPPSRRGLFFSIASINDLEAAHFTGVSFDVLHSAVA